MNFFVDDGVYLGQKANGLIGPVMHHGIKNAHDVEHHYYQPLGFRVLAQSFAKEFGCTRVFFMSLQVRGLLCNAEGEKRVGMLLLVS